MKQINKNQGKINLTSAAVTKTCHGITDKYREAASKALREEVAKKKSTADKLFEELSDKSEKLTEAKFCKKLKALKVEIPPEHAQLLCRRIESGGLSQKKFVAFVEVFFKVVKDTALTDKSDIKDSSTLRKLEKGEILKILDGPIVDEKFGVTRVFVQCFSDEKTGWATSKGNQGTAFMEETARPADKTASADKAESGEENEEADKTESA